MLGPRRVGNLVDDPYLHYAAAIQKLYEDMAMQLIDHYLGDVLAETGILAVAGTGSMNIRLNQRLAPGKGRTPDRAPLPVRFGHGHRRPAFRYAIGPGSAGGRHVAGPGSLPQCIDACRIIATAGSEELEERMEGGEPLRRELRLVPGRLEFGQRALGNRSVLANPQQENNADLINQQVKFREIRRPFACSILAEACDDMLSGQQADRYRCIGVRIDEAWRSRYPGIAYADGSTRVQVVDAEHYPDFHRLLTLFREKTGNPLLVNSSMSRPGEALVCSPEHAVEMFVNSGLKYLILENLLVTRRPEVDSW